MKCETCLLENAEGAHYCQRCGKKLKARGPLFTWDGTKPWAGAGQKDASMAPPGAMAIEKQTEELDEVTIHRTLVRVPPMEDDRWYCLDHGGLNGKSVLTYKGCGCDLT